MGQRKDLSAKGDGVVDVNKLYKLSQVLSPLPTIEIVIKAGQLVARYKLYTR